MDQEAVRRTLEPTVSAEDITGSTPPRHHFYDPFVISGVRVDAAEYGRLLCSFVVTPRLASPEGYLLSGVTATLADQLGSAVFYCSGVGVSGVSVELSLSYVDAATVGENNRNGTQLLLGERERSWIWSQRWKKHKQRPDGKGWQGRKGAKAWEIGKMGPKRHEETHGAGGLGIRTPKTSDDKQGDSGGLGACGGGNTVV